MAEPPEKSESRPKSGGSRRVVARRRARQSLALGLRFLLFISGLLIPVLVTLVARKDLRQQAASFFGGGGTESSTSFNPRFTSQVVSFKGPDSFLQLRESDSVWASIDNSNIDLVIWLNLKALPAESDRQLLLLRMGSDDEGDTRAGYAIAVSRTVQGVRLWVYLRSRNKGGWYPFPEISFVPKTWYAFALSLRRGPEGEEQRLGLHYGWARVPGRWEVTLLGGHLVPKGRIPRLNEPLLVGAPQESNLRGSLAAVMVYEVRKQPENYRKFLRQLFSNPLSDSREIRPLFGAIGGQYCLKCTRRTRRAKLLEDGKSLQRNRKH